VTLDSDEVDVLIVLRLTIFEADADVTCRGADVED
jgi:hypothetical protein